MLATTVKVRDMQELHVLEEELHLNIVISPIIWLAAMEF